MKRYVSFFLALMLALTVMIVPAMAGTTIKSVNLPI